MYRNILKGSKGSSLNVLLGLAVAAAIALGRQQASAYTPGFYIIPDGGDGINYSFHPYVFTYVMPSIPYGTTTINVSGTLSYEPASADVAYGMTVTNSDGTTLLGPIDLEKFVSTNYSGIITVPVGCGPLTNTITATGGGLSSSAVCVTYVTPALNLTENCDATIPYGTTTIHVGGTVTNIDPCATAQGVMVTNSDGTTLLGPIDLAGGAGTNYSATITVPVGCGPFTNTAMATGDGLAVFASTQSVTTVTVCPTDITVCNDPGACGAVVTYPTGGCGTPTYTPPSGSFFPLGTTTVTSGECMFTVTVNACDNRCPLGPGFWKSHPSVWPVNGLTLGTITYTKNQLLAILSTPIGAGKMADASLLLADELIAAKLNGFNGSPACPIASTIAAADALIGNLPIPIKPKITPSSALGQQMMALAATLDNYNNGLLTPGCTP
jgi:hypothetical protein